MMKTDNLEDELKEPYETWLNNQTPEGNADFVKAISPIVNKGIKMYGGADSPAVRSQGKLIALDAAKNYDRSRARLQSHILTHMQGLRRVAQQQSQIIKAPERVLIERQQLHNATQGLLDELGREPTDAELSDHLSIPLKRIKYVRGYSPGMPTGMTEIEDTPENSSGVVASQRINDDQPRDHWIQLIYDDLSNTDKKILEWSLGLNGQKILNNQDIAKKLQKSPGAITQRKMKIQKLLDQEQELSPFI